MNFFKIIYNLKIFCYNIKELKRERKVQKMKSLETVGRVTHTHTQALLDNEIASNSKAFCVPKNRRNLEYNRI